MLNNGFKIELNGFKNGFVWLKGDDRSGSMRLSYGFYLSLWNTALEFCHVKFTVTLDFCFQIVRKGVYHRRTNSVQSSGNFISSSAKFSSGVEFGENKFQCGDFVLRMHVYRNSASFVCDGNHVVRKKTEVNFCSKTCHGFIERVVHDFPDQVVESGWARGSNIHSRTLTNWFKSFQNLDLPGAVFCGF